MLTLSSVNIGEHPWVWDFFEQGRNDGQTYWEKNTEYWFEGYKIVFDQPVFARERKELNKQHGCAYEMIDTDSLLGSGTYGEVYRIACTISLGKFDTYQAANKKRVVKIVSTEDQATQEYAVTSHSTHLHMKLPNGTLLVMREIEGDLLRDLLKMGTISSTEDKLALTRALLHAYKEQVVDNGLLHNDLNANNFLVKNNNESKTNPFIVNIFDFSEGAYQPTEVLLPTNRDLSWYMYSLIKCLWDSQETIPPVIETFITQGSKSYSLEEFIEKVDGLELESKDFKGSSQTPPRQDTQARANISASFFYQAKKQDELCLSHSQSWDDDFQL